MLRSDQVEFYQENGYLPVPNVYSRTEISELNAVTDRFHEISRAVQESKGVLDIGPCHTPVRPQLRRIKDPTTQDPTYDEAMRNPRLLEILTQLIGASIRFDHSKLNIKPVAGGAEIDWHQDWAFYPHTNDDLLAKGVFLGNVGSEQGPLHVVPGSHRGPVHNHHSKGIFCGAITDERSETFAKNAVSLTGTIGSVTIRHVRMVHGSTANTGSQDRPLLLFSYAATDAWPLIQEEKLEPFNARILTGKTPLAPRQTAFPIRLPLPRVKTDDSIF